MMTIYTNTKPPVMRESLIEKTVTKFATAHGWLSFKWASPSYRGVPDRLFLKAGRVLIVEFKAPGKKPTKRQQYVHKLISDKGFTVHMIDSVNEGKRLLSDAA